MQGRWPSCCGVQLSAITGMMGARLLHIGIERDGMACGTVRRLLEKQLATPRVWGNHSRRPGCTALEAHSLSPG